MDYQPQLKVAIKAVSEACVVTRRIQTQLEQIQQLQKQDESPVTVADFAAQAVVIRVLTQALGPINMVGEENSADLQSQAGLSQSVLQAVQNVWLDATVAEVIDCIDQGDHDATASRYWTLDPIDGTKGFLRGGQYAISLALIENGQVVLGVLACPNLSTDFQQPFDQIDKNGLIYFTCKGQGVASVAANSLVQQASPLSIQPYEGLIRICESVESAHSKHDDSARIIDLLGGAGEPARLDSQCKYAVVARGQADAYLRLPTRADYIEKIWDHAGGMLIAQQAGMLVTDIDGQALDFSQGLGLKSNRGVICANKKYHAAIIDAIRVLQIGK